MKNLRRMAATTVETNAIKSSSTLHLVVRQATNQSWEQGSSNLKNGVVTGFLKEAALEWAKNKADNFASDLKKGASLPDAVTGAFKIEKSLIKEAEKKCDDLVNKANIITLKLKTGTTEATDFVKQQADSLVVSMGEKLSRKI